MITLIDAVEIEAPLDALYEWLLALDRNIMAWSPYHERFKKYPADSVSGIGFISVSG